MDIPERVFMGRPYRRPTDIYYDYEICFDEEGLRRVIEEINYRRYQIVSVTQDPEGKYTVIFLKSTL